MLILRILLLSSLIGATPSFAHHVRAPESDGGPRDANLNFWLPTNPKTYPDDTIASLRDRLNEELWLPPSFVESFLLGVHKVASSFFPQGLTEGDVFGGTKPALFLRDSISHRLALEGGGATDVGTLRWYNHEIQNDPRAMLGRLGHRWMNGRASAHLILGEEGLPDGLSAVKAYSRATDRRLVSLDRDADTPAEFAAAIQKAIHAHRDPVFVLLNWHRRKPALVFALGMLAAYRELLGDASLVMIEDRKNGEDTPSAITKSIGTAVWVDTMHVLERPRTFEDYAETLARWKFKGLDSADANATRRIAAYALDVQTALDYPATTVLRHVLNSKGRDCRFDLAITPEKKAALDTLAAVVREFYDRLERRF